MSVTALDTLRQQLGDRYDIERQLGRGGMGAVYLARDRQLDRLLAIKVLPEQFATHSELRERFLRETRTAAGFSHPNIVPVFAVEERERVLAMAMGFVEGESLAERVARAGPLTIRDTVRLLEDVGYALAYAHGRDVVHRDIKPENIMIERATGRALVMDFGISRTISTASATDSSLTRVGEVVGTPEYMSPEQASSDVVDGRSDLYALGLVAWFALTGAAPMRSDSARQVFAKQLTELLPSIATVRADVPTALADAIAKCLHKSPSERFQTAEAFVEAVDAVRQGAPDVPTPIRLFAQELSGVGPMLLLSVVAAFLVWLFIVRFQQWHLYNALSQIMVGLAIVGSRLWRVWQTARRVMLMGFSVDEVRRGLTTLMNERADARAMLRADAAFVRRRRVVVAVAIAIVPLTIVMAQIANGMRIQLGPDSSTFPLAAQVLFVLQSVLLAVALVTLERSPLRMPLGERFFRLMWLGAVGRIMFEHAQRGVDDAPSHRVGVRVSRNADAATSSARAKENGRHAAERSPQLEALSDRVEALERWRDSERLPDKEQ